MESHELKKTNIKNLICYYFDVIIKIRFFDFYNILVDEKLSKSILVYDILYKTLFGLKPLCIRFDEANGFIRACEGIRNLVYLVLKYMMPFTIELDILLAKKTALHIFFLIIMQNSKLILMILYI